VEITAQNHGFAVDPDSLDARQIELTHINLNDQTLEGFRHRSFPAFSVQYHPEASPGPHDSHYLFEEFRQLMSNSGNSHAQANRH
jgi:carbamoyl-phosphate synthase small subunit